MDYSHLQQNPYICPLLTDYYQISMVYAYWKLGKHEDHSVFDLFFRRNPFGGEFTVFCGLRSVIRYLESFIFTNSDIEFLKKILLDGSKEVDPTFFEWLEKASVSQIKIWAMREGTISFPYIPLLRVEGPLAICQLLETTLLNLVNFPSLITTNALRYRIAAGYDKTLLEFGVRRAQGPDGAMSASLYTYLGGFDGTSNVKASQVFGISTKGTHAHSFVSSFRDIDDLKIHHLWHNATNKLENFSDDVLKYRSSLDANETNEGELAAFIGYAISWPNTFMALVDTYDTLKSGVPNFIVVAAALIDFGYIPLGIRIDSGDLSYLSKESKSMVVSASIKLNKPILGNISITASNEINESTLMSLNIQGHEINTFGIGTHLVTCQNQTSLGGVYKLVMINRYPRLKISHELSKITIPCRKNAYRLLDSQGRPILDLMCKADQEPPKVGLKIMCRHPFQETKRAFVIPTQVLNLHELIWDGRLVVDLGSNESIREYIKEGIQSLRKDHIRFLNPTPYKVSVSEELYETFHSLLLEEASVSCMQ